jgi:antitoxin ParD1/3/4
MTFFHFLPNFAKGPMLRIMSTMNISLPESLKAFVDEQVTSRGYGTSSEYIRELIRKDQELTDLRALLLDGGASPPGAPADAAHFESLTSSIRESAKK